MRIIRCHIDAPLREGETIALPDAVSTHVLRVLRLRVGDRFALFNGDGHDYHAVLRSAEKRGARAELVARETVETESPLAVTLAQGIARGDRMDWALQKATELGVACVVPLLCERTEVRLSGEREDKRLQHWRAVMASACEQCGRARLPALSPPTPPDHLPDVLAPDSLRLLLDPQAASTLASLDIDAAHPIALAVGPEGGFADHERERMLAGGFVPIRFGPRVLRTETAGPALLAALAALLGDAR